MEHFVHEVGEHRVKSKGERAKYFVQFNILTKGTYSTQNVTFLASRTDMIGQKIYKARFSGQKFTPQLSPNFNSFSEKFLAMIGIFTSFVTTTHVNVMHVMRYQH